MPYVGQVVARHFLDIFLSSENSAAQRCTYKPEQRVRVYVRLSEEDHCSESKRDAHFIAACALSQVVVNSRVLGCCCFAVCERVESDRNVTAR